MSRKILLADDSVTAQNMGRKILVDAGYDVVTVNNGSAALKRVNESKPDLVVLDVYMPGYSGFEVCQRLKEASETAHIPVLLTVGKLEPFKPEEARRARADAHIVKPFEASELLSALARLEECIATSAEKANRKTAGDNGSARTAASGSDTSWRERLRFPAKKKEKKETVTEPDDASANFHDFRRSKAKTVTESPAAAKSAVSEKQSIVVPDIPRDITADELDALSAVAASLQASTTSGAAAPTEETQPAHSAVAETAAEISSVTPAFEAVNIASLAEEPAPVDRQDEPIFAAEAVAQEKIHTPEAEAAAISEPIAAPERPEAKAEEPYVTNSAVADRGLEESKAEQFAPAQSAPAESTLQEFKVLDSSPENVTPVASPLVTAQMAAAKTTEIEAAPMPAATNSVEPPPSAVSLHATAEPVGPPPSDEELAQALHLLTPATGYAETPMPSPGTLAAAGQLLAEEAARNAASPQHWIAEPVALTPDEASISLEAEMFGKFVADAAGEIAVPAVSQIATTIEPVSEAVADPASSIAGKEVAPVEMAVPATAQEASQQASFATSADDSQEPAPAATFADMAPPDAESACVAKAMVAPETSAAEQPAPIGAWEGGAAAAQEVSIEAAHEDSSLDVGGQPEMSKRGKQTPGKSKDRQTVESTATPEAPVVEAAMPAEAPEAPKTMAAAASADGASTAVPDPSAIASIVESVLADLRPKIVEEITKKLSRK